MRTLRIALCACLLGACSSGNAGPGPGAPAPADLEALFEARCRLQLRCSGNAALYGDVESCVKFGDDPLLRPGSASALRAAVAAGRVVADGARAGACLAAIEAAGCAGLSTHFDDVPACRAFLAGTVADHGACASDFACADGGICVPVAGDATGCQRTCEKRGVGCRDDSDCAPGRQCVSARCETPASVGQEGEGCNGRPCAEGLACVFVGSQLQCAPPSADGGACGARGECAPGLRCAKVSDKVQCTSQPPVQEGEACDPAIGLVLPCETGLRCVEKDDSLVRTTVCARMKGEGEDCSFLYECGGRRSSFMCDPATRKCVRRPESGPCLGGSPLGCDLFRSWCDPADKTCKPQLAPGAACTDTLQCGPPMRAACWPGSAGGKVCWPGPPGATACTVP